MHKQLFKIILFSIFLLLFFYCIYEYDNKYETPPPYGKNGIISLEESNFKNNRTIFLIDGWLLSDQNETLIPTYIGEYSNLHRNNAITSPHGKAIYQLCIDYVGTPILVTLYFPEVFTSYNLFINSNLVSQGKYNTSYTFILDESTQLIQIETTSSIGYYSGMYYPPHLSLESTHQQTTLFRQFMYCLAFFIPLVLALYSLVLWKNSKDKLSFWFGLFCCSFSLYLSYFFVVSFSLPFLEYWYFIENLAFYLFIYCVIQISQSILDKPKTKFFKKLNLSILIYSVLLLSIYCFIPYFTSFIHLHGFLKNAYLLASCFIIVYLCYLNIKCIKKEYIYIQYANIVFVYGLLHNLFYSNLFEPILFYWQFEWCGLLLTILFAAMMIVRNKRILEENANMNLHLEQLVIERTNEITELLEERKLLFTQISHDLKAPLYAATHLVEKMKSSSTDNNDMQFYLTQIENRNNDLLNRIQSIRTIMQMDKVNGNKEYISINDYLNQLKLLYTEDIQLYDKIFVVKESPKEATIYMQKEKLDIIFENLILNALKATEPKDTITILASIQDNNIIIHVTDTGSGIHPDDMPYIFNRFYSGSHSLNKGTGLGLYIVDTVLREVNGSIQVKSKIGSGTTFIIQIPIKDRN